VHAGSGTGEAQVPGYNASAPPTVARRLTLDPRRLGHSSSSSGLAYAWTN